MALSTTTLPDPSNSTRHLSASATVLLATLAGATTPSDDYIRGLLAEFLRDRQYQAEQRSTMYLSPIGHSFAESTTNIVEPDEWQELEGLDEDWDAEGAKKISPVAIAHAKQFLLSVPALSHRFSPFPDPTGSVGLQAREPDRSAYLLITPENRFTYVIRVGEKTHRGTNVDADEMKELLALLY